jgi:hypothetical protein
MHLAEIPAAFLALHRAGRFDYWGAPYRSLTDAQREERIRTHLTKVLWWRSIEWDREPEQIAAFDGDDRWRPGLIPFAGNGYGDDYCWYPRWQTGPEPPIVFCVHDDIHSHLFARTFAECLCRCLLQAFAGIDHDVDQLREARLTKRQLWEAHREILRPFLDPPQNGMLDALGADPDPDTCAHAEDEIAAAVGDRKLVGIQLPARYSDDYAGDRASLLRAYDDSIAFYRELVDDEGLVEFQPKLDEAIAARAVVARRV